MKLIIAHVNLDYRTCKQKHCTCKLNYCTCKKGWSYGSILVQLLEILRCCWLCPYPNERMWSHWCIMTHLNMRCYVPCKRAAMYRNLGQKWPDAGTSSGPVPATCGVFALCVLIWWAQWFVFRKHEGIQMPWHPPHAATISHSAGNITCGELTRTSNCSCNCEKVVDTLSTRTQWYMKNNHHCCSRIGKKERHLNLLMLSCTHSSPIFVIDLGSGSVSVHCQAIAKLKWNYYLSTWRTKMSVKFWYQYLAYHVLQAINSGVCPDINVLTVSLLSKSV